VFPNFKVGHRVTTGRGGLCARPYSTIRQSAVFSRRSPSSCIPPGGEESACAYGNHIRWYDPRWGSVLRRFSNMAAVSRRGMKCRAIPVAAANPIMRHAITNCDAVLARFMGLPAPLPLE